MMKLRILVIIAFFFSGITGICQNPIKEFTEQFNFGCADQLGHFYLVNGDQLSKIDSLGKVTYTYSDPGLGKISSIDASDPFRIIVYYRSFNQLVFIDRTLSTIGNPVKLDDLDIFSPAGLCSARQGGFWIIDTNNNSLLHLDNDLKVQTNLRLTSLKLGKPDQWLPMLEWNERLYICIPEQNILQFDLFGTQLKTIPVKANDIRSLDNNLLFISDLGIQVYQDYPAQLSELKSLPLPAWNQLIVSGKYALIQGLSGWSLHRLKKTP